MRFAAISEDRVLTILALFVLLTETLKASSAYEVIPYPTSLTSQPRYAKLRLQHLLPLLFLSLSVSETEPWPMGG